MTPLRKVNRIPAHLRPKRIRVYGVGDGRTGTTSLARMFAAHRAGHEVDAQRLVPLSTAVLDGAADPHRTDRALRRRSRRFNLEVDVANFLSPMAGELARLFDDAKFVLTIRDCFSWLDSRIEWLLTNQVDGVWRANFAARYASSSDEFEPAEVALARAGLRPLASYLRYWAALPSRVLAVVPADRICVIRTEDLDASRERLAAFVGIDVETLRAVHANHNRRRTGLLGELPRDFVVEQAERWCDPLMRTYWGPDWTGLVDRIALDDYKYRSPG